MADTKIVQDKQPTDTKIGKERVQHPEDMEIEHDIVTQEPVSSNLVVETATMELKE